MLDDNDVLDDEALDELEEMGISERALPAIASLMAKRWRRGWMACLENLEACAIESGHKRSADAYRKMQEMHEQQFDALEATARGRLQ